MKKIIVSVCLLCFLSEAICQIQPQLDAFNKKRNDITKSGMLSLGVWSVANIGYGAIAMGQTSGTTKYFHQMNLMWGGINLGLATLGYIGARKSANGLSLSQSLRKQSGIEKTYLFNAGLDLTYITAGFYLKERSKHTIKNSQKFKGYGESLILQGAALLVLDGVLFALHNSHGKKLYVMVDNIQIVATGNGVGVLINLDGKN